MKRRNRFFRMTSLLLVFALMLSLLPTQALALGSYGEPPETVAFKVMRMDGVRTVAPISKYLYGTKENQFFREIPAKRLLVTVNLSKPDRKS